MLSEEPFARRLRIPLVAALVLGACAGGSSTPSSGLGTEIEFAARDAQVELDNAYQDYVACMSEEGFDPVAPNPLVETTSPAPDEVIGGLDALDDVELASRIGLGFGPVALLQIGVGPTTTDPAAEDSRERQSDQEERVKARSDEECRRIVKLDAVPEPLTAIGEVTADARARLDASTDFARLVEEWRECMSERGYEVDSPGQLVNATEMAFNAVSELEDLPIDVAAAGSGGEPNMDPSVEMRAIELFGQTTSLSEFAENEIRVAVAAAQCRNSSDFSRRKAELLEREVDQLLDD